MNFIKILLLALVYSIPSLASDNILCSGGNCILIDNAGNKWRAQVALTTNGSGDIFTLGDVASADNIIGVNSSSNRTLVDNSGRRWNASVFYTTDGSGNAIPIVGGQSPLTFVPPLVNTSGSVAINGNIATNKISFVDPSDATKVLTIDLASQSTGVTNKIGFKSTVNTEYYYPPLVDATGINVVQNATSNQIFAGVLFTSFGGSNAGFQLHEDVANRASYRAFQWGNNAGIPGLVCEKLRSAAGTTTGSAMQVGDVPCKITVQGGSTTDGSAPIVSAQFDIVTQVGSAALPSAMDHVWQQSTKAGALTEQMRLTSEGLLKVSGGVQVNTSIAQPTCDVTQRGTWWVIQGGAGVADILQICLKNSSDVYGWVTK